MTDQELKAKIDSLVELEQPLTLAPFIEEARARATKSRDTKWMLDIITTDFNVNARRNSRSQGADGVSTFLQKEIKNAWTPLRQILNLELALQGAGDQEASKAALAEPEVLRSVKAGDVIANFGTENLLASINLHDYIALSLARGSGQMEELQVKPWEYYAKRIEDEAKKANPVDSTSLILAQALRVAWSAESTEFFGTEQALSKIDDQVAKLKALTANTTDSLAQALTRLAEGELMLSHAKHAETEEESDRFAEKALGAFKAISGHRWVMTNEINRKITDIEKQELCIYAGEQILPRHNVPIVLRYRNISKITINVYKLTENVHTDITSKVMQNPLATKVIDVKPTRRRICLSTVYDEMEGLPAGNYMLTATADDSKGPNGFCGLNVTQLGVTRISSSAEPGYALVVDAETGLTADAEVKYQGKSCKKNQNGWFVLSNAGNRNSTLEIKTDDETQTAQTWFSSIHKPEKSETRMAVILDRKVYKPGQTVNGKVFVYKAYRDKKEALRGQSGSLKFYGANHKDLGEVKYKTNRFGTATFEFTLPEDIVKGSAWVSGTGVNEPFLVEDFKRTDNSVKFDPTTEVLLPGDEVRVSGRCMAASGLPVAGAAVKYSISGFSEDESGETTTDDNGAFTIRFKSSEDGDDMGYYVSVSVTDNRGETTEAGQNVRITADGTSLEMNSHEDIVEGQPLRISLSSVTDNDADYKTKVHIVVKEMDCEQTNLPILRDHRHEIDTLLCATPHYDLGHEKVTYGEVVHEADYDICGHEIITIDDAKLTARKYCITATTTAAGGDTLEEMSELLIIPDFGHGEQLPRMKMKIQEGSNRPGDTITVRVGTRMQNCKIWLIGSRQGKIFLSQRLDCWSSVQRVNIPVPEDAIEGETLRLEAFFWQNGDFYHKEHTCTLHEKPNDITLKLTSFRDLTVPGAKETWTLSVGKDNATEIAASMYDKRLDEYHSSMWRTSFSKLYIENSLRVNNLSFNACSAYSSFPYSIHSVDCRWDYQRLFSATAYNCRLTPFMIENVMCIGYAKRSRTASLKAMVMDCADEEMECEAMPMEAELPMAEECGAAPQSAPEPGVEEPIREDFRETVFFYPQLTPDKNGDVTFSFEMPDNLTAYRFQALAHDTAMRSAKVEQIVEVRKTLNLRLGVPRFVTEGDRIVISADVTVTSDGLKSGVAKLSMADAETGRMLTDEMQAELDFSKTHTQRVEWEVKVPTGIVSLRLKAVAKVDDAQDGEQYDIPVALADIEVPESHPFFLFGKGDHDVPNPFTMGESRELTFSYSSNVFIEVLRALPMLDKEWAPCVDTYIGRLETSSIALFLKQKEDIMRAVGYLEKHADDLQTIADAEHTPWLLMAQRIKRHDKDVIRLMKGDYAAKTQKTAISKLAKLQKADGSFAWFDGMEGSPWLTASVISTIGEMMRLGLVSGDADGLASIVNKGKKCLDSEIAKAVKEREKSKDSKGNKFLSYYEMDVLYARLLVDIHQSDDIKELLKVLKKHWQYEQTTERIRAITIFAQIGDKNMTDIILKSIEENLVQMDENRAYVAERGLWRRGAELAGQAQLIIALGRMNSTSPNLLKLINHLICSKRGEAWSTTQITSQAVLALLGSTNSLADSDIVMVGGERIDATVENPRVSVSLDGKQETGRAIVTKSGETVTWGSWSRILHTPVVEMPADSTSALKVERTLEVRKGLGNSAKWEAIAQGAQLKVGDRVRVTLKFYNDDALSYVRVRDHRAAALEPVDKVSGYRGWWFWRWTNADIPTPPHYMSIGDETMEFFIDHVNDGWHSISYETVVTHSGDFTAGYADAMCNYSPEIKAHSAGESLRIVK